MYKFAQAFTVSFDTNGGNKIDDISVLDGFKVNQPENPTKASDGTHNYTFVDWYDNSTFEGDPFDFNTPITEDTVLYAKWDVEEISHATSAFEATTQSNSLAYSYDWINDSYNDLLENSITGAVDTNYVDWSDQSVNSNGIKYAGQSAGNYSSIQLRTKNNNSGVITTSNTNNLKAEKITISFNSNTVSGRGVSVYGSNTPYSSPEDLYDAEKRGEHLGDITKGTNTELVFSTQYKYIGIKSSGDAIYLDSINIKWSSEKVFDFKKSKLRFSTSISKSAWNAINEQATDRITKFGYFISTQNALDDYYIDNGFNLDTISLQNAFETTLTDLEQNIEETLENFTVDTGITDYSVTLAENATPYALDENYYKWSATATIDANNDAAVNYVGVAYIVVDGKYYFNKQASASLKDVATDMLENGGYEADYADGSLYYLAHFGE